MSLPTDSVSSQPIGHEKEARLPWGWLVLGAAILLLVWSALPTLRSGKTADLTPFWNLTLLDVQGHPQALSAYRGKVLVVNFWATWCPPCRREMPGFSRLQGAYRDRNVQFLGIAVDDPDAVRDFIEAYPVVYPILLGGDRLLRMSRDLGNQKLALPFTLLLDAGGKVYGQKTGMISESELEAELDKMLRSTANLPP